MGAGPQKFLCRTMHCINYNSLFKNFISSAASLQPAELILQATDCLSVWMCRHQTF